MLVALYTIASLVACALAQLMTADPPVITPNSATIWTVGATETVTWSAKSLRLIKAGTDRLMCLHCV